MKTLGLFDAKNRFSEVCDTVATTGEPVMVTRRGKPIAQIVPVAQRDSLHSVWDTVAESRATYGKLTDDFDPPPHKARANRPDPPG